VLRWPDNARVALCVIVTLERMEGHPPSGTFQHPTLAGGYGASHFPDVVRWSHREYGHQVGVFRRVERTTANLVKTTWYKAPARVYSGT
jgi:hypothetical protein